MNVLEEEYPCSFQQIERLRWMTREPDATFFSGLLIETAHPLDEARLSQALAQIMRWHPALRTSLAPGWQDHIQASCQVWRDLGATPLEMNPDPAELRDIAAKCFQAFDISHPPLWRAVCGGTASGGSYLALAIDHLLCDGTSAGILFGDLYQAYHSPSQSPHPAPATYAEFVQWQRGEYITDEISEDLHYWEQVLTSSSLERPVPVAGFDAKLARSSRSDQDSEILTIENPLWERLLDSCGRLQCSPFHLISTLLVQSLGQLSGVCDITLLCPVEARPPGFEDVVGWFANLMPVRIGWDPVMPTVELTGVVRDSILDALDHCLVPWDHLRHHFGLDTAEQETDGLVQVNMMRYDSPAVADAEGWRLLKLSGTQDQSGLDIQLAADAEALKLTCSYPRGGYPKETIAKLLAGIYSGGKRLGDDSQGNR